MHPGRIHAGLVHVVWELNEVAAGEGGTLFLSGSPKSAFARPEALSGRDSTLWETYSCPAGSAVIFTEALCHTGTRWTNTTRDRLSLFTCYNTVNAKWGKGCPPPEVIAAMPPLRRTLFRGVWHGMREVPAINKYHDEANTGRFHAGYIEEDIPSAPLASTRRAPAAPVPRRPKAPRRSPRHPHRGRATGGWRSPAAAQPASAPARPALAPAPLSAPAAALVL